MSKHGDATGGGEMPEILHRIWKAMRGIVLGFERERTDEPPYTTTWEFRVTVVEDELDGGWIAECLDLPGCLSQGETEAEAMENLEDAIKGVLVTRIEERLKSAETNNRPDPAPGTHERSLEVKIALSA